MDYTLKYYCENLEQNVEVEIKVKISTERNYAGVPCSSADYFDVVSAHTEQGEDIAYMFQGKNDLTIELNEEFETSTQKILDQHSGEQYARKHKLG